MRQAHAKGDFSDATMAGKTAGLVALPTTIGVSFSGGHGRKIRYERGILSDRKRQARVDAIPGTRYARGVLDLQIVICVGTRAGIPVGSLLPCRGKLILPPRTLRNARASLVFPPFFDLSEKRERFYAYIYGESGSFLRILERFAILRRLSHRSLLADHPDL